MKYSACCIIFLAITIIVLPDSEAGWLRDRIQKARETQATKRSSRCNKSFHSRSFPTREQKCVAVSKRKCSRVLTVSCPPVKEKKPAPKIAKPVAKKTTQKKKSAAPVKTAYASKIEQFRDNYIKGLLKYEQAPIRTPEELAKLRYFAPNQEYRFNAEFELADDQSAAAMVATDGSKAPFVKYGEVTFSTGKTSHKLSVYQRVHDKFKFFFIPFFDQSNGDSTYGGGRYLEFKPDNVKNGRAEIDFNKCYNPWCHYLPKFPCPIPPSSNFLEFSVLAGEKKYAGSDN